MVLCGPAERFVLPPSRNGTDGSCVPCIAGQTQASASHRELVCTAADTGSSSASTVGPSLSPRPPSGSAPQQNTTAPRQNTTASRPDGSEKDGGGGSGTGTVLLVAVIFGVLLLLCGVGGCVFYAYHRRQLRTMAGVIDENRRYPASPATANPLYATPDDGNPRAPASDQGPQYAEVASAYMEPSAAWQAAYVVGGVSGASAARTEARQAAAAAAAAPRTGTAPPDHDQGRSSSQRRHQPTGAPGQSVAYSASPGYERPDDVPSAAEYEETFTALSGDQAAYAAQATNTTTPGGFAADPSRYANLPRSDTLREPGYDSVDRGRPTAEPLELSGYATADGVVGTRARVPTAVASDRGNTSPRGTGGGSGGVNRGSRQQSVYPGFADADAASEFEA